MNNPNLISYTLWDYCYGGFVSGKASQKPGVLCGIDIDAVTKGAELRLKRLDSLEQASVVIGHFYDPVLHKLKYGPDLKCEKQVIIAVTSRSGGFPVDNSPHLVREVGSGKRILLFVRRLNLCLFPTYWKALFELTWDGFCDIVEGHAPSNGAREVFDAFHW
jgi:hypothetical protein